MKTNKSNSPQTKPLIYFKEEFVKEQKTKIFSVYSTHSNELLGIISWKRSWRCYVMSYLDGIDMSLSCSKQLNEFMEKL